MAPSTDKRPVVHDDLDDYGVDDFGVDPFAESGDENANTNGNSQSQKRQNGADLVGITKEIAVSSKARVPRVKLDENKLLSDKGISKLRRRAGDLKFKGKGHEWSDTARLLSLYQLWLDDLFPKAKFLDALAMIEKTGHTRRVRLARMEMIDEGRPRSSMPDFDDAELFGETGEHDAANVPTRVAPIFEQGNGQSERPKTPDVQDIFEEDDIYGATPRAARTSTQTGAAGQGNDAPDDEEDLDGLMAEEEAHRNAPVSIFGNGQTTQRPPQRPAEPDEDDLDALMAEAEAETSSAPRKAPDATTSKPNPPAMDDCLDDLDALMAEAEAEGTLPASKPAQEKAPEAPDGGADADEEEAMAEMDGLW